SQPCIIYTFNNSQSVCIHNCLVKHGSRCDFNELQVLDSNFASSRCEYSWDQIYGFRSVSAQMDNQRMHQRESENKCLEQCSMPCVLSSFIYFNRRKKYLEIDNNTGYHFVYKTGQNIHQQNLFTFTHLLNRVCTLA